MGNPNPERKSNQSETERDKLEREVELTSIELAGYEKRMRDLWEFFKLSTTPINQLPAESKLRHEEMLTNERQYTIAQHKLSSLLLKLLRLSSDQLDSSVRKLTSNVEEVEYSVRGLGNSSDRLETLTGVLVLVTVIAVSETVLNNVSMPLLPFLAALVPFLAYLFIRRSNRKFTVGESSR